MIEYQSNILFVLIAASSSGKGKLINTLKNQGKWLTVPKYSTRDNRGNDDDVVIIDDEKINIIEKMGNKTEIHQARISYLKHILSDMNGIVYYKNEHFYGFRFDEIIKALSLSHVAIVLSDFNTINKLKEYKDLQNRIKIIYIASPVDERVLLQRYKERENIDLIEQTDETEQTISKIHNLCLILSSASRLKYLNTIENILPLLNEEWNKYVPYFDTIKARSLNVRMLYNRYIDHITEVDYTILNFGTLDNMYSQAYNILGNIKCKRKKCKVPLFMVCAPLSSGKATLMEIVGDMGEIYKNIVIIKKYAKRDTRITDRRDGMEAIGPNGDFKEHIKPQEAIWEWSFHEKSTYYAVNRQEINENIEKGLTQIFISNLQQIPKAKQYYPDNIVILYLHAAHKSATEEHIRQKRKLEVIKEETNNKKFKNQEELNDEFSKLIQTNISVQEKYEKMIENDKNEINKVFEDYIKNIADIDHVLLNTGSREDMVEQMNNLIKYYS